MSGTIPHDALAIGFGAVLGALSRYQIGRLAADYIASDPQRLASLQGYVHLS